MNLSDQRYLQWKKKRRAPLPSPAADDYMLVPVREFDRIMKRIDVELPPRYENFSVAYFALFGAAVAASAAIPPLMTGSGLPIWVLPTFIASAAAFLLLGAVLVFVAHILRKGRIKVAAEISQEMGDIKETYHGSVQPRMGDGRHKCPE